MFYFNFRNVLLNLLASILPLEVKCCHLCNLIILSSEFFLENQFPEKAVQAFRFIQSPVRYLFQLTRFSIFIFGFEWDFYYLFIVNLIVHLSASYLKIQPLCPTNDEKNKTKLEWDKSKYINIKLNLTRTTVPLCAPPPWGRNKQEAQYQSPFKEKKKAYFSRSVCIFFHIKIHIVTFC